MHGPFDACCYSASKSNILSSSNEDDDFSPAPSSEPSSLARIIASRPIVRIVRIASSGGADADGVVGDLALTHVRNAHARKNCSGPIIAARCDDELNEVEVHSFTHSFVDARACDGRMRASNAAKVAFVSGNDGATFGEVNAIVFVVFAAACVCAQMRRVVVTHDDLSLIHI